jgi:hypothetical protein
LQGIPIINWEGWEGWKRAARAPEVRAYHRDTPRRSPRPTRAPPTLTLDLITREKKKTGEKVVNRVRSGRAPPKQGKRLISVDLGKI